MNCVKHRRRAGRPKKRSKPLCKGSSKRKSRKGSSKRKSRKGSSKQKSTKKMYLKHVKGSPELDLESCVESFHISHIRTLAKKMGVPMGKKLDMCRRIAVKLDRIHPKEIEEIIEAPLSEADEERLRELAEEEIDKEQLKELAEESSEEELAEASENRRTKLRKRLND